MEAYAFPSHVLEKIRADGHLSPQSPTSDLPDDPTLLSLLETCYHASLRTAELRITRCVLAYVSPQALPSTSLMRFGQPAPLNASELVRLAPVTELHRTLIGCYPIQGALKIWGLFEHHQGWLIDAVTRGAGAPTPLTDLLQNCLTITIEAPGALSVASGDRIMVRLREGRLLAPHEHPMRHPASPLSTFFGALVDDLSKFSPKDDRLVALAPQQNRLLNTYITTITNMLEQVRSKRHGGSIVIATHNLPEQLAFRTYKVVSNTALVDVVLEHGTASQHLAELLALPANEATEAARHRAESVVRQAAQRLLQGVKRVSLLAAIDGAVLLNKQLAIEAFGVRFPVFLSPNATILDVLSGTEYPCDSWGLRHQSVFSVCQHSPGAVGFIVSQDGNVKAVKTLAGRLHFWDGILD